MKTRPCFATPLAAAALAGLALAGAAHAASIGQLGILQGSANGGINPATGNSWQAGDQYRLAFVTTGSIQGTSTNIGTYNTFVQNAATASSLNLGGATWNVIASTAAVAARDNTSTNPGVDGTGVAIFLVDGITKIADNSNDLWDGSLDSLLNLDENGNQLNTAIFGGTENNGVQRGNGRVLGNSNPADPKVTIGRTDISTGRWMVQFNTNATSSLPVYGLSELLTVQTGGPDTDPPVLASTTPADNSSGFPTSNNLVATFDEFITAGTGNVTIRNLAAMTDTVIPVSDASRISISGKVLTIDPATILLNSTAYAVQIDSGAIFDEFGNAFPGIAGNTIWNFTTGGDPLLITAAELEDHINGVITLNAAQIDAHKQVLDAEKERFDESAATITAVFDLLETYDAVIGPLWIARGQFDRDNQGNDLDWTIYHLMQYIMDEVYNAATIASFQPQLNGFKFGSAAHFPGPCDPPADPRATFTATINGSFPDTFGRDTQHWTFPARKPTGCYLAPGTIATVTVPPSLVNQGYQVRVGAHSWDMSNRRWVRRLDRATILYDLDATSIEVASPYGGGIYIEVPFGANAGVVNVDITGAVRSPYFSAKSFHTTTLSEWLNTERNHPAPWADFQTDKFMMQVPTNWIYAHPDPVTLMADWDAAMDAMNDLMGFPHIRGKETMYPQVDVIFRVSVYAPGYPSTNINDNPNNDRGGYHTHHLVRGPQFAGDYEFHEQGHAYFFPKFGGETESAVNFPHVAVQHRKFGATLDEALATSRGFGGNPHRTLDNTAVTWMTSFNFSPREVPMDQLEKQYQMKGHAKFVDIVRLFGWAGLDAFWYSYILDEENGDSNHGNDDDKLLRLSQSVGVDIRPLFHFWGIHPQNPSALEGSITAAGLPASAGIYDLLLHYKSLVPANNGEFRTFATNWWGGPPSINGFWTEAEHARQWDSTELFGAGDQQRPNGEIYVAASAADIEARVQELIDIYFPGGRPVTDYETWATQYPGADLTDPAADLDGDGISNDEERIFGLDPTDASSRNPQVSPLDAAGTFSYTRRDPALTGRSFSVWTTTDLDTWTEDTGASELPSPPDANDVETVTVGISPALLANPKLFVQVRAE